MMQNCWFGVEPHTSSKFEHLATVAAPTTRDSMRIIQQLTTKILGFTVRTKNYGTEASHYQNTAIWMYYLRYHQLIQAVHVTADLVPIAAVNLSASSSSILYLIWICLLRCHQQLRNWIQASRINNSSSSLQNVSFDAQIARWAH